MNSNFQYARTSSPIPDKTAPQTLFVSDHRNRKITSAEHDALRIALAAKGDLPDTLVEIDLSGKMCWTMDWPRNIPWKSLPVISESRTRQTFPNPQADGILISPLGSDMNQVSPERDYDLVVRSVRRIVVWDHWKDTPKLRGLLSIWDERKAPVVVSFFDGLNVNDATPSYVSDLKSAHEAEERFLWNYKLNFVMICSRAIAQVASEFGELKDTYARIAPRLDAGRSWIANPLSLHILYRLKDEDDQTPIDPRPREKMDYYEHRNMMVSASPVSSFDFTTGKYSIRISGSGTYPAYIINDLAFDSHQNTELNASYLTDDFGLTLGWLSNFGYISLDAADRLRLTAKGHRLLELLGPGLNDPDVLLRWRSPTTGGWKRDAIPAIDRWINRTFREVKRRMATLHPAPVIERDVSEWTNAPEGRSVVLGFFKRIEKSDLADPEFAKSLASAEASSLAQPFKKRRFGVLRDTLTMDNDYVPIAFWVGIPVGIYSSKTVARNYVGPLIDQDALEREAKLLRDELGSLLSGHWENEEPCLLGVGRTSESYISYFSRDTSKDTKSQAGSEEWHRFHALRPATSVILGNGISRW